MFIINKVEDMGVQIYNELLDFKKKLESWIDKEIEDKKIKALLHKPICKSFFSDIIFK
ncbi:hypothetical protein GPS49_18970 [Acinetobacter haemolyticus]|nr:hypothetical protein [Acinetobacter haemolyticus]